MSTTSPSGSTYANDSFDIDPAVTTALPTGQLAHQRMVEHGERVARKLWEVAPRVWCLVGNGLSNQTFVEGPGGLIVIDTGESIEEMTEALEEIRQHTSAPIAAVLYTHFHYVAGTQAVLDENTVESGTGTNADTAVEVWGHERIDANRRRMATELSAAMGRGLVHQFGIFLPTEGPDGMVHAGLGPHFRNPAHAPFTGGYVAPQRTFSEPTAATIAGLQVEFTPAPSDSDDSVTIWFPELGVCVNNIVWPALFNVFPIRGEEYRDPRILLNGIDHVLGLEADHLIGAHGPPISGKDTIANEVTAYRDSIQFMWDQTVRALNRGLTSDELATSITAPESFRDSYLTSQLYGVLEHHVRQIHTGLLGWFDGNEARLFPLPPAERAQRLIEGFGGRAEVMEQAEAAAADNDLRWALELASWLVRSEAGPDGRADGGSQEERGLLASVLRQIGQRTTSANVRNWCMTRAVELDGELDLTRFRVHRFSRGEVLSSDPDVYVHTLRVLVDPERTQGVDGELAWHFDDGTTTGLRLRNHVAVPTDGADADATLELSLGTWALVLGGKTTMADALAAGDAKLSGDSALAKRILGCFDVAAFEGLAS